MLIKTKSLPPHIAHIVRDKATEHPFSGEYYKNNAPGTYLCRQCGLALFRSQSKFHSGCGWPSFDGEIANTVMQLPDKDGQRTEILCNRCQAHLGHVFTGEGFTANNLRHCVNSLSLDYVNDLTVLDTAEAIFAAGCFWGVEYYFKKLNGVLKTEVGYINGKNEYPTYEDVCSGTSGHLEALRVIYDYNKLSYAELVKYFFEIHDPYQKDGQGPDLGEQYLSAIFYFNEEQKEIAEKYKTLLEQYSTPVATQILPIQIFWQAESYHQDYYTKTNKQPYCHHYTKRFD